MAAADVDELYRACRDGDVAKVKHLLPRTSLRELNRQESNGSSCLPDACRYGHEEIVRLLLEHGVSRQIKDRDGRTPFDLAKTNEIREYLSRPTQDVIQHYGVNEPKQLKWVFGQDNAEAFSRAIQWGCIKDRGVKKTVQKIYDATIKIDDGTTKPYHVPLIPDDDESKETKLLRYYLDEAREKNDPTFLLRAYTINSEFYRRLNKYMAEGSQKKVFKKLCGKWSGYYTGTIMKNSALERYGFADITYRGMVIDREALQQYQPGVVLANKSFQSTSKLRESALQFAAQSERKIGKVSVLIQYMIRDRRSAFDIRPLSEFPNEDEVLMVPGCLFKVDYVDINTDPCNIHLRQLVWNRE